MGSGHETMVWENVYVNYIQYEGYVSHSLVPRLLTLMRGWGLGMRLCEPQYEGYVSHSLIPRLLTLMRGWGLGMRLSVIVIQEAVCSPHEGPKPLHELQCV